MLVIKSEARKLALGTGLFLLSFMLLGLMLSTLLFCVGIPIGKAHLFISAAISLIVTYLLMGKSWKYACVCAGIALFIVFAAVMVCICVYDRSWDGNAYHKDMIAFLRHGWNPLRQTFYDFADEKFPLLSAFDSNYLDAYPKGTEILAACMYAITGNIEAGKFINIITIVSLVLIAYWALREVELKTWQAAICAGLLAINPVTISQIFTFYIDGLMWNLVLLCAIGCLGLTFFKDEKHNWICYYLIFATINIGFNTKFSAVIFFALLCGSIFVYWCITEMLQGLTASGKRKIITRFSLLASAVVSGFCFVGATSYVVNTIRHKNPFYSIFGEGANEIIDSLMPALYQDKSNIYRFFHSLFSKTGSTDIKIPFSVTSDELYSATGYDTNVAGWGILLGGIIIIAGFILLVALIDYRKKHPGMFRVALLFIAVQVIAVVFVPGLSWARYYIVPLYIPVCAIIYLFRNANSDQNENQNKRTGSTFLAGLIAGLLLINVYPNITYSIETLGEYQEIQADFHQLRVISQKYPVEISCRDPHHDYNFYGRLFNLYDNGITEFAYAPEISESAHGSVLKEWGIYYKVSGGFFAADNLADYVEEAVKDENILMIFSVKDEASSALTDEDISAMQALGLDFKLKDGYRCAYAAIVDSGGVLFEKIGENTINHTLKIGEEDIAVSSSGYYHDNRASILLNGQEMAVNGRGINIVLYDKEAKVVLDSVCIDTYESNQL